jgi:hypothetical protein
MPSSRGRGSRPARGRVGGRGASESASNGRTYRPSRSQSHSQRSSATPSSAQCSRRNDAAIPVLAADVPDDDFLEQVILAIDIKEKGRIGCAYYIAAEGTLLCMEDIYGGGSDVADTCESILWAVRSTEKLTGGSESRPSTHIRHSFSSLGCCHEHRSYSPPQKRLAGRQW